MLPLSSTQLEFLDHTAWWAAGGAGAGAGLLLFAWLNRRVRLHRLAALLGVVILAMTALLYFSEKPRESNQWHSGMAAGCLAVSLFMAILIFYRNVYAVLSPWRRRTLIALRAIGL